MNTNYKQIKFSAILEEYAPNELVDDEYFYNLKDIINNLPETDRAILILYADLQSMDKVAERLGVSKSTIYVNIKRIREQINEEMKKLCY